MMDDLDDFGSIIIPSFGFAEKAAESTLFVFVGTAIAKKDNINKIPASYKISRYMMKLIHIVNTE